MKILLCILIGYLLGCLSPAMLLSKLKKTDLRAVGTGNLGATNTALVFGKRCGIFVLLFDVAKAFIAVKVAQLLIPAAMAGIIAGGAAVVGHICPFYLGFNGGKGLAAFMGLILAADPLLFTTLVVISLLLMFIINYSVAMPMSIAVLFPLLYGVRTHGDVSVIITLMISILIIFKFWCKIGEARRGEDLQVREYVKKLFINSGKKSKPLN